MGRRLFFCSLGILVSFTFSHDVFANGKKKAKHKPKKTESVVKAEATHRAETFEKPEKTRKAEKHERPQKVESESPFHQHSVGVGLQIAAGTFSGISVVMPYSKRTFLQGNLGVAFLNGSLSLTGDYVVEFPDLIDTGGAVVPYAGGGVVFLAGQNYASLISDADGSVHFGARLPLGAYMMLDEFPVNVFGEVTPGLLLLSSVTPILSITLGFRWMF